MTWSHSKPPCPTYCHYYSIIQDGRIIEGLQSSYKQNAVVIDKSEQAKVMIGRLQTLLTDIQGGAVRVSNQISNTMSAADIESPDQTERRHEVFSLPLSEVKAELKRHGGKCHGKSLHLR